MQQNVFSCKSCILYPFHHCHGLANTFEHDFDARTAGAAELNVSDADESMKERLLDVDVAQVFHANGSYLPRDDATMALNDVAINRESP